MDCFKNSSAARCIHLHLSPPLCCLRAATGEIEVFPSLYLALHSAQNWTACREQREGAQYKKEMTAAEDVTSKWTYRQVCEILEEDRHKKWEEDTFKVNRVELSVSKVSVSFYICCWCLSSMKGNLIWAAFTHMCRLSLVISSVTLGDEEAHQYQRKHERVWWKCGSHSWKTGFLYIYSIYLLSFLAGSQVVRSVVGCVMTEHVTSLTGWSSVSDRLASHASSYQFFHPLSNCTVRKSILVNGGTGFHILTSSFTLPRAFQSMVSDVTDWKSWWVALNDV